MEPLFTTETAYTYDEYKRFNLALMRKNLIIIYSLLAALLLLVILSSVLNGWSKFGAYYIPAVVFVAAYLPFGINLTIKRTYKSNKLITKTVGNFSFYESKVVETTDNATVNYKYSDLSSIIETQTNFYLMIAKNQGMIIVKQNCSAELIEFLKGLEN